MKIREQIDNGHKANLRNIRESYHDRQEITHEEYHVQLNAESERYDAEIAANFPPEPVRDYSKEIDELKARLDKITKVNGVA